MVCMLTYCGCVYIVAACMARDLHGSAHAIIECMHTPPPTYTHARMLCPDVIHVVDHGLMLLMCVCSVGYQQRHSPGHRSSWTRHGRARCCRHHAAIVRSWRRSSSSPWRCCTPLTTIMRSVHSINIYTSTTSTRRTISIICCCSRLRNPHSIYVNAYCQRCTII